MKIAILGGAFNPVHREHVRVAQAAIEELKLDKLIIMPTAVSPHKGGKLDADFWQRFEMCSLAFKDLPQAEVSNYELTRGGVSYTYLTCEYFSALYEGSKRYFIMGEDMLKSFPSWKNPAQIIKYFTLAACARGNDEGFAACVNEVENLFSTKVATIPYVGERVSSTQIRTLAALGENFDGYVNADVCQYIKDKGIYRLGESDKVKSMLTPERWAHTVRVAGLCAEYASRAKLDERQAITMALLHDCAKYLPADSPLLSGFTPPDVPETVLHQYSGAYVAEHTFGITDRRILDAIRYHTTGRENMTEAEKLLFLADMLEEGRTFEGVNKLRKAFKEDMDECLYLSLAHQVEYLKSKNMPIDPMTERAYEYIRKGRG